MAEVLSFVPRSVEELAARYNAFGAETLGDQRRRNGRCTAPGCLDNRLAFAARLKVCSCQVARMSAGLR